MGDLLRPRVPLLLHRLHRIEQFHANIAKIGNPSCQYLFFTIDNVAAKSTFSSDGKILPRGVLSADSQRLAVMPLSFRPDRTARGKPELIASGKCEWQDFPRRAQAVVDHFGMTVTKQIDGLGERLWIARIGESQFCVSWDVWFPEVSIMAWEDTPDAEVERLTAGA